jgi:hypothetical protein
LGADVSRATRQKKLMRKKAGEVARILVGGEVPKPGPATVRQPAYVTPPDQRPVIMRIGARGKPWCSAHGDLPMRQRKVRWEWVWYCTRCGASR